MPRSLKRKKPPTGIGPRAKRRLPAPTAPNQQPNPPTEDTSETVSMQDLVNQFDQDSLLAQTIEEKSNGTTKSCTWPRGYVKQAIFSCRTCDPDGKTALCLGCSLNCHLDHDIIELWTRRGVRCDCGNSRFAGSKQSTCALYPGKTRTNERNTYNQNFKNKFCYCQKIYKYGEDADQYQCGRCQDWFHSHCVSHTPRDGAFFWLCKDCVHVSIDAVGLNLLCAAGVTDPSKLKHLESSPCKMLPLPKDAEEAKKALRLPSGKSVAELSFDKDSLSLLCRCEKCTKRQTEKEMDFLWDHTGDIQSFDLNDLPDEGKEVRFEYNNEAQAAASLNVLPRENTINGIHQFGEFASRIKDSLRGLLKPSDSQDGPRVVSGEEMKALLSSLLSKK